jgi:hypothetical protein
MNERDGICRLTRYQVCRQMAVLSKPHAVGKLPNCVARGRVLELHVLSYHIAT